MTQASRLLSQGHDTWVCVAKIRGAHGVKGELLIEPLTEDPAALKRYKTLYKGADGPLLDVTWGVPHKGCFRGRIGGVESREDAQSWNGVEIFIPRTALKALDDDVHYHADLLGMSVSDDAGNQIGTVTGVANYGSAEVLEIKGPDGMPALLPFIKDAVLDVDKTTRQMVIDSVFLA